ncbi:MAG: Gfo/Idh/MocA family oxidoreductase [Chloroflexota bacterium]
MLRIALFGAGRAGTIHARNIASHPQAKLSYVFDIDPSAAERIVASYGGQQASDPDEIWQAGNVDAILIASATNTHVDLLREAVRAHKPTYCEKPIDLDITKVKQVVAEVGQTNLPIFIGFRRRFLADIQRMYKQIKTGALGQLETIHIVARDLAPPPIAYVNVSGGLLRDKMIHYFDLAPWLVNERPSEVYAMGSCLIDPTIGEAGDIDTATVMLRFPSGVLCTIENGRRCAYGVEDRVELFGARGMLQAMPPHAHHLRYFSDKGLEQGRYPDLFGEESFASALDAFITAVQAGNPVSPSLQDGLQAQLIAEAAVQSLQINQPVPISYDV